MFQKLACLTVLALLIFAGIDVRQSEAEGEHKGKSAEEVARELANPNTSLGFLAFILDYNTYDGDIPDADDQDSWRLSFQPSIPYPLAKDTNFFLRPLIPIILDQPVPGPDGFDSKGVDLGDIGFEAANVGLFREILTIRYVD